MNLYFNDQVNENNEYDEIGLRYNCFRFASQLAQAIFTRQISSFCMSESSKNFHIENENSVESFSFNDLSKQNITSDDLYIWSIPIDIIEQYQIYLEFNDSSLGKQMIYNCTLPIFGSMCQYELYYYQEKYSTFSEFIHTFYQYYIRVSTNLSCYIHLKYKRGYPPACLDWTEICDGKVDCLDGNYDEEHCWQLELNECQENEFKCNIGQCIPNEFVQDDIKNFDCLDRSDKELALNDRNEHIYVIEPIFGYEDARCQKTFMTGACDYDRPYIILTGSMFSIKDKSVLDDCWSAFESYFQVDFLPQTNDKDYQSIIKNQCPDMLYERKNLSNDISFYLCSNKSFNNGSLRQVVDISLNNTSCVYPPSITSHTQFDISFMDHRIQRFVNKIFQKIRNSHPIINFPQIKCNTSNMYQCKNSSKCISFHRLVNHIFEDSHLFTQLKHKYYKCYYNSKYILQIDILNGKCDCGEVDEEIFCEDEDIYRNFTRRTIMFPEICDYKKVLYPIMIDGTNHTDETECDNSYTRCDGIIDCLHGVDELGCDFTPLSLNCSSYYQICVKFHTNQFICLAMKKINDGQVDCLGGTDEKNVCGSPMRTLTPMFYCRNSHPLECVSSNLLCDGVKDYPYEDDEEFCQKHQTIPMYRSICGDNYISLASTIERFLCHSSKTRFFQLTKTFTIPGLKQSFTKQENRNEIINSYRSEPMSIPDNHRCYRGLDVRVWLNKSSKNSTNTCFCPPSYYGNQCQYQNERLSLSIRFHISVQLKQTLFIIFILLIDNANQRMIHSYEQFTYLSIRDCKIKFNIHLYYLNRPKDMNKTYSIHIDIYETFSLKIYRGSFFYPIKFLFLPVHHRLAFLINIPLENDYSWKMSKLFQYQTNILSM
ncbi:hypothetical protein I4U23_027613 [Adineta vaga]|nr:hypothetical protein I4U23_027613 [Adineta vaga]